MEAPKSDPFISYQTSHRSLIEQFVNIKYPVGTIYAWLNKQQNESWYVFQSRFRNVNFSFLCDFKFYYVQCSAFSVGLEIAQVTLELELVVLSELPLAAFSINVAITLYY